MFLNTFAIGRWSVLKWKDNARLPREPTCNRINKPDRVKPFEEQNQNLLDFIDSVPAMESHYCRTSSNKKYLLPEWASIKSLHEFYVTDWCQSRNVSLLSITTFSNVLSSRNVALFHPKKYECEKCAAYKLGYITEDAYRLHIDKKMTQDMRRKKMENLKRNTMFSQ